MTSERPTPDAPAARKASRSLPPLAWIAIAVLLAGFILLKLQAAKTLQAPHGGTAAQSAASSTVAPATPASKRP